MIQDVLYMTWDCPDCAIIKVLFENFNTYAFEDDKLGKKDQSLVVIQTYSNVGARYVLKECGDFEDDIFTPVLKTFNGIVLVTPEEIIKYLKENFA